jgi:hypothetical protein
MTETSTEQFIEIERMSVDQLAGAFVMIAGAIGSLLLVIWQSKCHCKMNLCYIFSCERRPPNEEEMKGLKEQAKKLQAKQSENKNQENVEFKSEEDYKKQKLQEDYIRQKPTPKETENSSDSATNDSETNDSAGSANEILDLP